MSMFKAAILGLMIPATLAAPALAQDGPGDRRGPAIVFEEVDLNGDGAVTLEELQAAGEARFAATDADGSGTLDRDELLAQMQERAETRVDRMIARVDENGDGVLSQEEIADAREMRSRGPNPERMFQRLDADGNGEVTQAEFDAAAERFMERRGRHGDRDRG